MNFQIGLVRILAVCLLAGIGFGSLRAQDDYAAVVTITYPGVDLKRQNTDSWLPLAEGAQAPLGPGDVLRTDHTGRAQVRIADQVEIFLLPRTTYQLITLTASETSGALALAARLDGQLIQRLAPTARFESFSLETQDLVVSQPAALMAVWSAATESSVVTVAEGTASVMAHDETTVLEAGQGMRARLADRAVLELDGALTAPRLIGKLDGCPGTIHTAAGLNLNVRVGPGLNTTVIGSVPNDAAVRVMAISASGNWLRIQYLSGFGWLRSVLVEHDCTDIPVLPNTSVEQNVGLFNVTPADLAFLEPFYGPPADDLWFYRSLTGS